MNLASAAQQVLRHAWRDLAPECCVCRRRVDAMEEPRNDVTSDDVFAVFLCHGKSESVRLPGFSRYVREPARAMLAAWPKRVFLKNWARYSLVKPKREGRLE